MSLLQMLVTYKATIAVWGLVFTPAIGAAAVYETHSDRGVFGMAPIPGPTVYLSPTATPTVTETETRVLPPSPSVSVMTQMAGPTALPSPATTETLIVPLPVGSTATVTSSTTPSSTPTPSPTRTGRNHANGLDCFILVEVDHHGDVVKRPCPKEAP
jgi:hypothetical protein